MSILVVCIFYILVNMSIIYCLEHLDLVHSQETKILYLFFLHNTLCAFHKKYTRVVCNNKTENCYYKKQLNCDNIDILHSSQYFAYYRQYLCQVNSV